MPSAKDLRRRIASVKNTQQITKAMKMVSAAKLRRAQDAVVRARPYANKIRDMVYELSSVEEPHPLQELRKAKKAEILLFTSDRGLCGGFNSNLCKKAESFYYKNKANYENISFLCAGKRGKDFVSSRNFSIHHFYQDALKKTSPETSYGIAMDLIKNFMNRKVDETYLVFAEFKSALSQKILVEKILPVLPPETAKDDTSKRESSNALFLYEPSKKDILEKLLPMYITTNIHRAFLESAASEHGARMAAMDSATTNAGKVIGKLTLLYNSIRQAGITKELLEITSGAEAL